jgi:GntR family transcriptional regulator, transcriptional repressor for pyruvate dehydrogenase complex
MSRTPSPAPSRKRPAASKRVTGTVASAVTVTPRASAPDTLFKPAKPQRAFEQITRQIELLITEGHLKPGDKLPTERALAAQLEVSRNTLREALRMLEIAGVLTLRRGASGGAFVAVADRQTLNDVLIGTLKLTDFSVADLTQAMRAITVMLFQAALPKISEDDFRAMESNIQEAERVKDDPRKRSELLIHFYRLLAEATGNQILVAIADVFVELLKGWVARLGSLGGDRVLRSRRAMLKHLRAGNSKAALSELEQYLDELHEHWLRG